MWKGKKRFGGGGEPAAKRQAAGDDGPSESTDEGIVVAEISKNRRVAVRSWNGKTFVDIREFYVKDGKTLPTRKGTVPRLIPSRFSSIIPGLWRRLSAKWIAPGSCSLDGCFLRCTEDLCFENNPSRMLMR
ncbi:hypothetical protein PR202_ga01679 [Eleusine coracana subsp. coracana]|uniref:Transcriptional coactivator p15 (PC4) C-terminal domain-containing protein n=1 Tax=Eleusine coracana subsp. coracana TaxID=191504 RepID=A0AAV5BK87_ELECO|nr:hypothetical protein PR202_ga00992 [Eleusine coracana subsp. coracana]GJM85872.1 hypothetical protein PR202_ga01679 [Eleusine coracana subsp. coracana]